MGVSGAEAVVAASSPFIGQGESACLVRPYVDLMTPSEIHLTMTSGFSTIAGSVLTAYINLGVPATTLVTSSVMSIPASIAISKLRFPEREEPITRGNVVVDRGIESKHQPANALHAFSNGASFGLLVAGQILTNVLTVLALVYTIDGLLTYIGKGFAIHHLTLELIFGYISYPHIPHAHPATGNLSHVAPHWNEIRCRRVCCIPRFASYPEGAAAPLLTGIHHRKLRSLWLWELGICRHPDRRAVSPRTLPRKGYRHNRPLSTAPSALFCGFISTMQTAGIPGTLV
ncbi:hypothetical protein BS47DRAFT_782831 [Hydnum rufescens UP504]|uniref:Concentrative nucleoside transporter C-terminal domain-containing protein n=1 Tax=Hydnum rufescens UP504 TaxID=1448309 RepID=A0A9P6B142_9AGAM|nr:hypothetical protein BS47DRAFT_782831 [Hydnum rufescens UP504]